MPTELDKLEREIMQGEMERTALKKEKDAASKERLAKLEKEYDCETMKNPTPAMLLHMERMKNRATLEHSESFTGRRKVG